MNLSLRLRHIEMNAHFNQSELTHAARIIEEHGLRLAEDDVIALVSRMRKQIVFVHGFYGGVLASIRLRLYEGETWSPEMLAEYAKRKGIRITNMDTFEKWFTGSKRRHRATITPIRTRKAA